MIFDKQYLLRQLKTKDSNKFENCSDDLINQTLFSNEENETKLVLEALADLRNKIGESMKTEKICFLMANGCSIYAGSNSTKNVIDEIDLDRFKAIKNDLVFVKGADVEAEMNQLSVIKEYYTLINDKEKISQIEEYIKIKKSNLLKNYVLSLNYSNLNYHEALMIKLRAFNVLPKTSFFTPNYDLALEYTLDKMQQEFNGGFTGFINRKFNIASFDSYLPNIVKVHGSLNWFFDEKTGEMKEIQPLFDDEGKIIVDNTFDSIIYPSSQKLSETYNAPYSELLRFMLNQFQTQKNVIFVIGYKYGDEHINDVLLKSLSNPYNIYYFFDYDEDINNQFMKQIRNLVTKLNNINIISGNILADFRSFVTYLIPACAEKTDQEKIFDLLQKVMKNDTN